MYGSTEEFRTVWEQPNFETTSPNEPGKWTRIEANGQETDARNAPAPITVQPSGPRYHLDRVEQHVSWMGFDFYIAFSQAVGITLYDICFRGEPVIYELGLQEAMSQYAGNDPVQGAAKYLDTFFGMGKTMFELVPGKVFRSRINKC